MKTFHLFKGIQKLIILSFIFAAGMSLHAQAQQKYFIAGQLADQSSMKAVAWATVALLRLPDSTLLTGTASDEDGKFLLESVAGGSYRLLISAIGYRGESMNIKLADNCETGIIYMHENAVTLGEIVVSGERKKTENGAEKTTYFINKRIYDASNTGADLIGFIPGITVDIMKNISLGGSRNIVILVDGKEREINFLSQLDAGMIDKVEVTDAPDSRYDAGVTGVINIILRKDRQSGVNGYINAEAPSSGSEIYLFPSYSLSYGIRKLNLYTSYSGEVTCLDIFESSIRTFQNAGVATEIISEQDFRQNNWSHRFHYGFDYIFNDNNQINFYAYNNPWSRELDGRSELKISGDSIEEKHISGTKDDTDINNSTFWSIYYKHSFAKPGSQVEFDLSNYHFKAENATIVSYETGDQITEKLNKVMPGQNSMILRIGFTLPLSEKLRVDAGIKTRLQMLQDRQPDGFKYRENIFALHGSVTYKISKYTVKTGLRSERSSLNMTDSFNKVGMSLLPDAMINYRISPKQNLKLSYNSTVKRPGIYDLNPYASFNDPFDIRSGNPYLKPEFRQNLSLGYSNSSGSNYMSFQIFYRKRAETINKYTFLNESGIFETRVANLGAIHAYGFQMTHTAKLLKIVTVNSFFNLYNVMTAGNSIAGKYRITDRQRVAFESGISAMANFRYDIIASFRFQYDSPETEIQAVSFSDPLYFVSLEKTFLKKFRFGIKSALPFSGPFTYQGTKTEGVDFSIRDEGKVILSRFPLWFSFRYQFSSGKKINRIDRTREEISNIRDKGF